MRDDPGTKTPTMVSPEEAFSVLGNDTRITILRTLADADGPLYFTELRERVGLDQGRQFNYHLDKVVGHFVQKTDDGYSLAPPGERVVEAVLSGVMTDAPIIEPSMIDQECYHCGAPIVTTYQGALLVHCTSCAANYEVPAGDIAERGDLDGEPDAVGLLRGFELPPAGVQARSASETLRVGNAWANLERIANRVDICPRCSATIDGSLQVCETHDVDGGACEECGNRYAVNHVHDCTNCNYGRMTQLGWLLLAETEVLHFLTSHGINPIAPESPMEMRAVIDRYEEEVVSADPFRGRFTFTIDEDSITLTIGKDIDVVDATRHRSDVHGDRNSP